MKKFNVSYRNEFSAEIEAKDMNEAVRKFIIGKVNYTCNGNLHDDYIEVLDENGNEIYQNQ